MFLIRDANTSDVSQICKFNQKLAEETENKRLPNDVLEQGVRTAIETGNRLRYWVATPDDKPDQIIGQVAVSYEWSDWRNGWIWWLQSVYVDKPMRGQGVFRALLENVKTAASADSEVIGLRLYVEHQNAIARQTYQRLGFVTAGYEVLECMWADQTRLCVPEER